MLLSVKLRYVRISVKKAVCLFKFIQGMRLSYVLNLLEFSNKKVSSIMKKLLKNYIKGKCASKFFLSPELFSISNVLITKSSSFKKKIFRAKGRVDYGIRKLSHITVFIKVE